MKVAICTPYHGGTSAEYAQSLGRMLLRTAQTQITYNGTVLTPQLDVLMKTGSVLPWIRNLLVEDALRWGANYLLWIDSDHYFPDWGLLRLLSLNLPVVGANYPRRVIPTWPTAAMPDGTHVWTTQEKAKAGEISEVGSLGLGFCLIDMTVILDLLEEDQPLFAIEMTGKGRDYIGEDVFFFRRCRKAGFSVHLDHLISQEIGHLHTRPLTNADAVQERLAYEAQRPDVP